MLLMKKLMMLGQAVVEIQSNSIAANVPKIWCVALYRQNLLITNIFRNMNKKIKKRVNKPQTKPVLPASFLKDLAHEHINKCKNMVYKPYGRNAGNEIEGDYGSWRNWEARLILFGRDLLRNYR